MVFYSEWDIQVHVANHMLGRKQCFLLCLICILSHFCIGNTCVVYRFV